jgi:beta-aspartyl-peptidase (threonine type)
LQNQQNSFLHSGGIPGKLKGRIGDAPLIGCGGYANKEGGATTTGHGEALMKITLAREVVYNMEKGQNAQV